MTLAFVTVPSPDWPPGPVFQDQTQAHWLLVPAGEVTSGVAPGPRGEGTATALQLPEALQLKGIHRGRPTPANPVLSPCGKLFRGVS